MKIFQCSLPLESCFNGFTSNALKFKLVLSSPFSTCSIWFTVKNFTVFRLFQSDSISSNLVQSCPISSNLVQSHRQSGSVFFQVVPSPSRLFHVVPCRSTSLYFSLPSSTLLCVNLRRSMSVHTAPCCTSLHRVL